MTQDDLRRRATRSIGWVVAERWGSKFLALGVLVVLTRLLDPSDFGLVSLATSVISILAVFVDSGLTTALIQKRELDPKDASTAFWASLGISIVLAGALVLCAPVLASAFGEPDLAPVLQALSLVLPISALSRIPAGLLERDFDFKSLSVRQLVGSVGGAAISIPLALLGFGVWALVGQTIGSAVIATIALWASTSWRPRLEFSMDSLRSLWRIGVSVLGIELLDAVQGNIDKIVVGIFFNADELGIYYLAQRLGTILVEMVTSVISRISLTTFSRVQDDLPRVNRIYRRMTFAAAAVSFPIFGLVAVLAPQIVPAVFGPGWDASIPLIWILAPGWAVAALMYFDRGVLLGTGHATVALGLAVFQNIVGIALVFAFVPLGLYGIALSRLARIFTWPVRLWVLKRLINLDIWKYLLEALRCLAAVSIPLAVVALLQLTPWASGPYAFWTFAVPLAVATLPIYGASLWLVAGAENRQQVAPILAAIRRRFSRKPAGEGGSDH